jgi:hypothetical protein
MAIADIDPADARLAAQSRAAKATPKVAEVPAQDSADVIAAKKLAADIAAATGQTVDPNTGQIVVDPAAIAAKFPEQSGASIPAMNNRSQEPRPPQKGYRWRWVSMAKVNNPYGGEWREEWAGGVQDNNDSGGNTNTDTGLKTEAQLAADLVKDQNKAERKSAYDLLLSEFKQYGLEALVAPLKSLIEEGVSPSEFTIRLRETDAYKKRFAANAQRVAKGLRALSEAEYIGTEDQYQDVMRRYGMPESYYAKGDLGVQSGFEKFLAGDVSAVELEDRIQTAQNRVVNSNPEVSKALKEFYPGISNGDILAYVLDPTNAIEQIKRKVTAAEIGGAAIQSGLKTGMTRAEELAAAGITKQQAQTGFQTVAEVAPRGGQLAEIYKQSPYTQTTAEQEVFGLAGSVDAAKQRKKLTQLETASFSGSAGTGAIARDRAGAY